MKRISETELILPTLYLLTQSEDGMTTSDLIKKLEILLKPTGEDMEILSGRSDTKFSQKVRNLRSHKTLSRPGLATMSSGRGSKWRITDKGRQLVNRCHDELSLLLEFPFQDAATEISQLADGKSIIVLDERIVTEGELRSRTTEYRTRSRELREAAIEFYAINDKLECSVCKFDYSLAYPNVGAGYIQLHHLKPIAFLKGEQLSMLDALDNVRLLCANCHQMVHRKHPPIPIDELQSTLQVSYTYSSS